MDVPSMVQRSGDKLIVRSVVSGNQLYFDKEKGNDKSTSAKLQIPQQQQNVLTSSLGCFQQFVVTDEENVRQNTNNSSIDQQEEIENQIELKDEGLPQCKIKRNYSCNSCTFFTQNPRYFLTHLRDKHGEKIVINECKLCLYASRHYQKLVRHMKMVHGSTDGIEENGSARKRQLGRETRKRKIENQSLAIQVIPKAQGNSQNLLNIEKQTELSRLQAQQDQITFYKQQKVEDFLEDTSKNRLLKCSLCDFTTLYRSQLVDHETDEHCNAKFFRCEKCSYVTHIKARFSKHVKYHSMPMIKCFTCDFRTPYKWNLDRHMKNHGGSGAFKCAACNFTADIKQSLTVHEMNHHIPPVGHAAGMTNMRRRNKVGGTDISDDVLSESGDTEYDSNSNNNNNKNKNCNNDKNNNSNNDNNNNKNNRNVNYNDSYNNDNSKNIFNKNNDRNIFNNNSINNDTNDRSIPSKSNIIEINKKNDDNIISEQDGFPTSTKKFKYNYEDLPTDLSHKSSAQGLAKPIACPSAKSSRPIPNLIPIQTGPSGYLSSRNINLYNDNQDEVSNLRQIATMLFGKEIPQELLMHLPQLSPCSDSNTSSKSGGTGSLILRKKSENFFDKLKQRFAEGEGGNTLKTENLTCTCGHTSKCLSELYIHQNACQNIVTATATDKPNSGSDCEKHSSSSPINLSINSNSTSTRCQYCRHRCKSSADLINHLKNCSEIGNCQNDSFDSISDSIERTEQNLIDEDIEKLFTETKHPMENKVFIWNDINKQNKSLAGSIENYSASTNTADNKEKNTNLSKIDINPSDIGNQYCNDEKNDEISYYGVETAPGYGEVTKKITSEEDAANSSLKKVYKCPHCSFWASTASRFHVHIVGHLNKKPFECSLCNYRSNWRWDITKHIRLKTIRDPSHKNARVLMNDETGRRNYTKYNKYITLMKVTDEDGDPKLMKSGEMTPNQEASLSFLKDYENKNINGVIGGCSVPSDLGNNSLSSNSNNLINDEKKENINFQSTGNELVIDQYSSLIPSDLNKDQTNKRSPPGLIKPANINISKSNEDLVDTKNIEDGSEKNKLYRCKECNYKHVNRDMLVAHVKQHTIPFFSNMQQMNQQKSPNDLSPTLQVTVNSNYTNIMNDMLAIILNNQQSGTNIKSEKDFSQQVQTYTTALNLNLVAAAAFSSNQRNNNNGSKHNSLQNEHGEMDEASSVGVVTTTTTTPTNNTSFSPNATASTNHLLNTKIQSVNNNKNNNDICSKNINIANTSASANTMVFGNSTSGSSNTSIIGGIILGRTSKNNIINTHSAIEQNINHNNFNNILNHSNNMGNNGGNLHNNTDQWRGPAPYRCGHCHQVSNWKHVIQRHCRLKHNGDIRIETIDRSSDRFAPVYRPLGANLNHQLGRRSSQNIQNNQLQIQQKHNDENNLYNTGTDNNNVTTNPLYNTELNEKNIKGELFDTPATQILSSGNSSKSKQQLCPECSYVSESKSQMNYHISLHKAKQYECNLCGLLFNKKQQLFVHTKNTHDDQQQNISESNLTTNNNNVKNNPCNKEIISNRPDSNLESSDNENYDEEEEGKLVIDLMSTTQNTINNTDLIVDDDRSLSFCQECPTRFLSRQELLGHLKFHKPVLTENVKLFYKCEFCSFKAKQEPLLLSHFSVHRQGYQDRTGNLLLKFSEDKEYGRPNFEKIKDVWIVKNHIFTKSEDQSKNSQMTQSNSLLKKQLETNFLQSSKNKTEEDLTLSNDKTIQFEKCPYCPFETNNSNLYKDHLKCHYVVSKAKSKYLCSHCDYSSNEEQNLKAHIKFHFNSINNNETVAFFTSYNNLELNLGKDINNASENNENTSNSLVLYRSSEKKVFTDDSSGGDSSHNENINCKNVIDIKTGQIVAVESSPY